MDREHWFPCPGPGGPTEVNIHATGGCCHSKGDVYSCTQISVRACIDTRALLPLCNISPIISPSEGQTWVLTRTFEIASDVRDTWTLFTAIYYRSGNHCKIKTIVWICQCKKIITVYFFTAYWNIFRNREYEDHGCNRRWNCVGIQNVPVCLNHGSFWWPIVIKFTYGRKFPARFSLRKSIGF